MKKAISLPNLDVLFRALSDLTRLRILNMLLQEELCVCDIVTTLDVLQPAVSRHLAYLRKTGLVQARKEGQWVFYRMIPATTPFHKKLLECLEVASKESGQLSADLKTLRCNGRTNCC